MTFSETNVQRDTVGRFSEKLGSAPELDLTTDRDSEIAAARDADTRIAEAWNAFHAVNDKAVALRKSAARSKKVLGQYPPASRERIAARIER